MNKESIEVNTSGIDVSVAWEEIKNKPNEFVPVEHTHDTNWSDVIGKPTEFTPEFHTHDEYAKRYHKHTVADIIGLEGFKSSNGGSDGTDHNHDNRYYTKGQADAKLSHLKDATQEQLDNKSDIKHTHNVNDLQGLENVFDCYKQFDVGRDMLEEDEDGFYIVEVVHGLSSRNVSVRVNNANSKELLVDISILNENRISILTDEKEDLIVLIKKINLT